MPAPRRHRSGAKLDGREPLYLRLRKSEGTPAVSLLKKGPVASEKLHQQERHQGYCQGEPQKVSLGSGARLLPLESAQPLRYGTALL